jgi:hypothetical protein
VLRWVVEALAIMAYVSLSKRRKEKKSARGQGQLRLNRMDPQIPRSSLQLYPGSKGAHLWKETKGVVTTRSGKGRKGFEIDD